MFNELLHVAQVKWHCFVTLTCSFAPYPLPQSQNAKDIYFGRRLFVCVYLQGRGIICVGGGKNVSEWGLKK